MSFAKRYYDYSRGKGGKSTFSIDTSDLDAYIKRLQTKSYTAMMHDVRALVRQSAQDIRRVYLPFVPISEKKGARGKYGFTSGNLKRSLRIFQKRQVDKFVAEFSVGFKKHNRGALAAKVMQGKKVSDGYYGAWVNAGVAGRQRGKSLTRSNVSQGFRERAKNTVNATTQGRLSARALKVLKRRLEKDILKNG